LYSTPDVIHRILDNGANINTSNKQGNTSLMFAIEFSVPDVIHRLLDSGANVNTSNNADRLSVCSNGALW
jgi:ankyrin repeat protein